MIQEYTVLNVADNTGAKKVRCFRIYGGTGRRSASVGDIIMVSVRTAIPNSNMKKGSKARAVIVRTTKEVRRAGRFVHPLRRERRRADQQGQ
jgi:large subunit ribosomal protein L14